jgi:hypothetical protein
MWVKLSNNVVVSFIIMEGPKLKAFPRKIIKEKAKSGKVI